MYKRGSRIIGPICHLIKWFVHQYIEQCDTLYTWRITGTPCIHEGYWDTLFTLRVTGTPCLHKGYTGTTCKHEWLLGHPVYMKYFLKHPVYMKYIQRQPVYIKRKSSIRSKGYIIYLLNVYIHCLSVCFRLFVRLYAINVKTAEPIGSEFCVGPHMTPGKVYGFSKKI